MINVLCLKHGDKYNSDYVNRLYNMVNRHLTIPHRFVCFTESSTDLNPNIDVIPLPKRIPLKGWWWKPYLFKQGHFDNNDTNLFFDLDMVIVNSIDKFLEYEPESFVGLKDVGRVFRHVPVKLGSAVMKWPANHYSNIWNDFVSSSTVTTKYRGDQDWIWECYRTQIKFFPDIWIQSYKWEIRNRTDLIKNHDRYIFKDIKNPVIDSETSVLAFHGTPNPCDVFDPIIVDNWK